MALPTEQQINFYNQFVPNTALTPISAQDKFATASVANTAAANLYLASAVKAETNATTAQVNATKTAADVAASAVNAALAKQQADLITAEYNKTALYTDAALLNKSIYANTIEGIPATPVNGYFSTPSADSNEFLILYKVTGTTTLTNTTGPIPDASTLADGIYSDVITINGNTTTRVLTLNNGTVTTSSIVVTQSINNTLVGPFQTLNGVYSDITTVVGNTSTRVVTLNNGNVTTTTTTILGTSINNNVYTSFAAPTSVYSDTTTVNGLTTTRVVKLRDGSIKTTTTTKSSTATKIKVYPSTAAITTAIADIVTEYTVANTFYISAGGSDTDTGSSWKHSLRTIEGALVKAWAVANAAIALGLPPPVQLIEWAPESPVFTRGHLDMPDNCVVKAVHRTVFLRPELGYEQRNVFRMGSGCFLEGVMFEGWQLDDLNNPSEGFAVSFRPGAVITRVPYAHKIAVRAIPKWTKIAPPLDAQNGNPLVERAGGVVLADGLVCSQYSIFPNIMTWGATPVLPNGIGYCAKNGGLINAVNAVSIWAHKHFLALNGGQIILSACSTQFGDYSLVADGGRNILNPQKAYPNTNLSNKPPKLTANQDITAVNSLIPPNPANTVNGISSSIVDTVTTGMLDSLIYAGYTGNWDYDLNTLKTKTKSDAALLLQCIYWTLESAYLQPNPSEQPMLDFAKGMFDTVAKPVYIPVTTIPFAIEDSTGNNFKLIVDQIKSSRQIIIDKTWNDLVARGYTTTWSDSDEALTRRDTGTLLTALCATLTYGNYQYMGNFVKGLYTSAGDLVISYQKLPATLYSFNSVGNSILALSNIGTSSGLIKSIIDALISNFSFKTGLTVQSNSSYNPASRQAVIDGVWNDLLAAGYTTQLNDATDQTLTRRDTGTLYDAVMQCISEGNEQAMIRFAYGLYSFFGTSVISDAKMPATIQSFELIKQSILGFSTSNIDNQTKSIVTSLIENLKTNAVTQKVSVNNYYSSSVIANAILANKALFVSGMWSSLKNNPTYYNANAITSTDEFYTRRDAGLFVDAIATCLRDGNDTALITYGNSFFISFDISVIAPNKMPGTLYCYSLLRDLINNNITDVSAKQFITALVANLISNMSTSKNAIPNLSSTGKINLANSAAYIKTQQQTIINNIWYSLSNNPVYYNSNALTAADEALTRRDTATLLTALCNTLTSANEKYMLNFTSGLYEAARVPVIPDSKIPATIYSFYALKRRMTDSNISSTTATTVTKLIDNLISNTLLNSNKFAFLHCWSYIKNYLVSNVTATQTFKDAVSVYMNKLTDNVIKPNLINEPSRITAIGHTWTAVLGGVALTKVPPANNNATIQDSIIESNNGIVIASGQDDQGNALFVGGLQISADTGELGGPPFDQAVRRVATKTAISRSF